MLPPRARQRPPVSRELTLVEEALHQARTGQLKHLLRELRTRVEPARAAGATHLSTAERARFRARYEALLDAGPAADPRSPPLPPPSADATPRCGRPKQSLVRNLLDRLWTCEDEALLFRDDLAVPVDNNGAERALRMIKVQQQISGTFRGQAGAHTFCRLLSVLSTWRKQGRSALDALETLFAGQSLTRQLGT